MNIKIKFIFLPFISYSFSFIALYTSLHWLLLIKLELFHPTEILCNYGIPLLISGIIVLLDLRKRIKLLAINSKSVDFYSFVCWAFLAIPVIISQFYLDNQQGKLTSIEQPSMIDFNKQTLFYSIEHTKKLNRYGGLWVTRTSADRGNEICINCYFACPLLDTNYINNYSLAKLRTWIGVRFSESFSNRVFDNKEEQKNNINDFIKSTIPKCENYLFNTKYLRNLRNSFDRDEYFLAIERTNIHADRKDIIILSEEKGSYETRTGNSLKWLFGMLIGTNLIWLLFTLIPKLNSKELQKFGTKKEKERQKKELLEVIKFFKPVNNFWATPVILDINLLIFIIMIFCGVNFMEPEGQELIKWGANYGPLTSDGQQWRLLTSIFIHAGIIHLANNMFALGLIGYFLEKTIGSLKFMTIYILTGLIASFASLLVNQSMVSLGASGAIFGIYGLVAALLLFNYIDKNLSLLLKISIPIFIIINLILSLKSGVDMAAHLGGLISGFVIGITYFPLMKELSEDN